MNSGIYKWENKETGNVYIGQALDLNKRVRQFLNFEKKYAGSLINEERKKYNSLVYWNYTILEECEPNKLNELENKYINYYPNAKLLNIAQTPKVNRRKPKIKKPKNLYLCPLSYMYKVKKIIDDILFIHPSKYKYGLEHDLKNLIKLIKDERIKIIKKHNFDNNFLYNTLILKINKDFYREFFNASHGCMLWALFQNVITGFSLNNKNIITFINEDINIKSFIGRSIFSDEIPETFEMNEMFYNIIKDINIE